MPPTITSLLEQSSELLTTAGVESPFVEARQILQCVFTCNWAQLILRGNEQASEAQVRAVRLLVEKRINHIPLAYLTGEREFWGLNFAVSTAVLIPRPETEFVLEQVFKQVASTRIHKALDLGTGSGILGIILALELGCEVWAVDISPEALGVAAVNAKRHRVEKLVSFIHGDLFAPVQEERFDLLVSNPPYIRQGDIATLDAEVRLHEPNLALSGGPDGLEIIGRIAEQAGKFLNPGAWLFVEIGAAQEDDVYRLFRGARYAYRHIEVLPDWSDRPRLLKACMPS